MTGKDETRGERAETVRLLKESAVAFAAKESPLTRARALRRAVPGFDRAFWRKLAEQGWTGLLVPEKHGGFGLDLDQIVGATAPDVSHRARREAKTVEQARRRRDRLGHRHRKVQFDPLAVVRGRQQSAARVKARGVRQREAARLPQRVGARQCRVSAETHFSHRREPTQIETVGARFHKRRLRQVHLGRHVLHPNVGTRDVKQAHGRGIATEGF